MYCNSRAWGVAASLSLIVNEHKSLPSYTCLCVRSKTVITVKLDLNDSTILHLAVLRTTVLGSCRGDDHQRCRYSKHGQSRGVTDSGYPSM